MIAIRSSKVISTAIATALTMAALAPMGSPAQAVASGGYYKPCGSQHRAGAGWYNVRAHHVGCRKARQVARHYWRNGDSRFDGWRCRARQIGEERNKARCHRHHNGRYQVVRFLFGA